MKEQFVPECFIESVQSLASIHRVNEESLTRKDRNTSQYQDMKELDIFSDNTKHEHKQGLYP
ncbi:hypothetical protein JQC92_09745 [Shewanella sp. 202IG2-18]|uniref:hypothetical protein n=1 Tax=Parashewanella hymeniacidonis TaxID=2807618 RepID=UPI001960EA43|nr:hypothetical protein [Parashewanella hymeniacidonis]MBM7072310.1 hypothetical protein [Parashewanella hymeniacidonis]